MSEIDRMIGQESDDPLYSKLLPMVVALGEFRVDRIQRTFLIGYNRASRLMERLEKEGHIQEFPDERGGYFVAKTRAA